MPRPTRPDPGTAMHALIREIRTRVPFKVDPIVKTENVPI